MVKRCNEEIMDGWTSRICGRPGKWWCKIVEWNFLAGKDRILKGVRCGIHAKRHKILEPYTAEQSTGGS